MKYASIMLMLLCSALAMPALAVPPKNPAKPDTAKANATPITQTDVVGSKEAPAEFNIVPWKNDTTQIPKKEISASILQETLQPLDRDVLNRQIQLQQVLTTK